MPQAILLKKVDGIGEAGAVIDVSAGYLRNYLEPRGLAAAATAGSIAEAVRRREEAERIERERVERAQETAALLGRTVLTIAHAVGQDGRLFGSVTTQEIADAIRDARGIRVDKRSVSIEEPIKQLGSYMVAVQVTPDVTTRVKTLVVEKS